MRSGASSRSASITGCTSRRCSRAQELTKLIENYPRAHYSIIHMGEQGTDRRFWREGDLGGLTGEEVFEAVANGRLWLNLRRVNQVDGRYSATCSGRCSAN